jgi:hypothetical protein
MKLSPTAKRIAKRILPRTIVQKLRAPVLFDNSYGWLNQEFSRLAKDPCCQLRPQYLWGVLQAAALARVLEVPRISVIEFGVAGGFGLCTLDSVAGEVERTTHVGIDVIGFDTGTGLPKPEDYRDQPNMWFEGQLPMDRARLQSALRRATLRLGRVEDTVPSFIAGGPAPIGFVSFDLDLYSSTRDALQIFEADHRHQLPRVITYFDDIFGYTYNDYCGERLAIREFNERGERRKICPIQGLRYFLPRFAFRDLWPDGMHFTHFRPPALWKSRFDEEADGDGHGWKLHRGPPPPAGAAKGGPEVIPVGE